MQDFPHHYVVKATADLEGDVAVEGRRLPGLKTAPPEEFGGPGDRWSPETLLVAAVADCFVLSFRAIARASKLDWISLDCEVSGVLDRVDRVTRFVEFSLRVSLTAPAHTTRERAERLLQKAEESCLITNSLVASVHLETTIDLVNT